MAQYVIPPNTGKVRIVMGLGGTYVVWNGKNDKNEFKIVCRKKQTAQEVMKIINGKLHKGSVEVHG